MANELSAKSGSSLAIAEQFPEGKYNLLVPIKTVTEIADIHKPVMNVVYISTAKADKEVYEQSGGWALTKKALTKLMKAAGIRIIKSEPILPTKCEKCAAVNRGIGRPVNCGACPNRDVKHQVTISMPQLTGENVEVVASKEILYDDVVKGMSDSQAKEFSKFRSEMCETKALNRALRIAMQIKPTYTLEELKKARPRHWQMESYIRYVQKGLRRVEQKHRDLGILRALLLRRKRRTRQRPCVCRS